jgi:hypothetical protein
LCLREQHPPRNPKIVWQQRKRASRTPTFAQVAEEYLDSKSRQWPNVVVSKSFRAVASETGAVKLNYGHQATSIGMEHNRARSRTNRRKVETALGTAWHGGTVQKLRERLQRLTASQ